MFYKPWLLPFTLLLACWASTGYAIGRADTVPASVSGVNYTDEDISYQLFDPNDPKQRVVASEAIGPFAAGGVQCCYDVPKTWKPGIQVGVILRSYDNKALDYRPDKTFIVELPPYDQGGKAGDVWFINYPDGTVGVVSTAYRPNGEGWPGKIKGWPKPSIAFQRELWERDMLLAQQSLASEMKSQAAFAQDTKKYLHDMWAFYLESDKNHVAQSKVPQMFTGPDDPAFLVYEQERNESGLRYSQDKVDRLLKVKP